MRILPYILYLFLFAFYRTILVDIIEISGVGIDMAALLVVLVAIYKSETVTLWFALCMGIMAGAQQFELMPWEILFLTGLAVFANEVSARVNLESKSSRLLIVAIFVFVHKIIVTLIIAYKDIVYLLWRDILPTLLYTSIAALIFFGIKDGNISWKKVKALF